MELHPGQQIYQYTILREIDEGMYGRVYLVEWMSPKGGQLQGALKMLKGARFKEILDEVSTWAQVSGNHPNILRFRAAHEHQGHLFIVSDFAADGNLDKWILDNVRGKSQEQLPLPDIVQLMKGILSGLVYLHEKDIVHRDIKPKNILLDKGVPKLADFGLARGLDVVQSNFAGGTPFYLSPKLVSVYLSQMREKKLQPHDRTELDDLWACAVMFQQMLTAKLPFDDFEAIRAGKRHSLPEYFPIEVHQFFEKAFSRDENDRYQTARDMSVAFATAFNSKDTIIDDEFIYDPALQRQRESERQAQFEQLQAEAAAKVADLKKQLEEANSKVEEERLQRELEGARRAKLERETKEIPAYIDWYRNVVLSDGDHVVGAFDRLRELIGDEKFEEFTRTFESEKSALNTERARNSQEESKNEQEKSAREREQKIEIERLRKATEDLKRQIIADREARNKAREKAPKGKDRVRGDPQPKPGKMGIAFIMMIFAIVFGAVWFAFFRGDTNASENKGVSNSPANIEANTVTGDDVDRNSNVSVTSKSKIESTNTAATENKDLDEERPHSVKTPGITNTTTSERSKAISNLRLVPNRTASQSKIESNRGATPKTKKPITLKDLVNDTDH